MSIPNHSATSPNAALPLAAVKQGATQRDVSSPTSQSGQSYTQDCDFDILSRFLHSASLQSQVVDIFGNAIVGGEKATDHNLAQNMGGFRDHETPSIDRHHPGYQAPGISAEVCAGVTEGGADFGADIRGLVERDASADTSADHQGHDAADGSASPRAGVDDLLGFVCADTDFYQDITATCDVPTLVWGVAQQGYEEWAYANGLSQNVKITDVLPADVLGKLIHRLASMAFERIEHIQDPHMEQDLYMARMDWRRANPELGE